MKQGEVGSPLADGVGGMGEGASAPPPPGKFVWTYYPRLFKFCSFACHLVLAVSEGFGFIS